MILINNLDLTKYCIGYDKHKSYFDLFGICNHVEIQIQVIIFRKNQNNKWYEFNDETLEINALYYYHNAYVLFYRNQIKLKYK